MHWESVFGIMPDTGGFRTRTVTINPVTSSMRCSTVPAYDSAENSLKTTCYPWYCVIGFHLSLWCNTFVCSYRLVIRKSLSSPLFLWSLTSRSYSFIIWAESEMPLRRFVYNLLTFSHINSAILIDSHPAAVILINIVINMAVVIYINISTMFSLLLSCFAFHPPL